MVVCLLFGLLRLLFSCCIFVVCLIVVYVGGCYLGLFAAWRFGLIDVVLFLCCVLGLVGG